MTTIQKINNNYKKPILTPKNTGYLATGAILVTSIRAFTNTKPITKSHKIFGLISIGLTLLHVGLVEYLHYKYKKM
jgi:hypothetical protein